MNDIKNKGIICLIIIKMKPTIFRIRKTVQASSINKQHAQFDSLKQSIQHTNQKMLGLMEMFQQFMQTTIKKSQTQYSQTDQQRFNVAECEVRDRYVLVPLPKTQKLSKQESERWITSVYFKTFSVSFHNYLTEQMTFQQTKVFCSENILYNMLKYAQQFKPKGQQLQNLNKHIGKNVLQYLQKKYPLTQSNDVNKILEKQVQQTNHLQFLTNDFLYNSKIMFKYSQDGNYNDMIMRVINKAIQISQGTSSIIGNKQQEQTNYNDFQNYMSNIFDNVYDEEWMTGGKKIQGVISNTKIESNKDKYQEKVKGYTNHLIGRKISENTVPYTQHQIKSKNLIIKSPAILRILTKWCEELWQKFQNPIYFRERAESIQLQNPQMINPFFKWMREAIDNYASEQKDKIIQFKMQLMKNGYSQQAQFLFKHLDQDSITSIPKYQKASGKFATQIVKNLHTYITLHLNRLIHGLLTVSKKFYQIRVSKDWEGWQSPPNLITFKIGDILRCKMSSKQKQIVKVFKQIKMISDQQPQRMKIVRIKNRLKQGTHDILINIKFNNSIVCQIQLEVINKSKSKFIQCSNTFSHYIYQMRRSIFGPISQLCSIWYNYQARASQYEQLIELMKSNTSLSEECISNNQLHRQVKFDLPFQCSYCNRLYYHNNYIITNKKCQQCNKYKCGKCQINKADENSLKKKIFKSKADKQFAECCQVWKKDSFPSLGVCIKIQSTSINPQIFQTTQYQGKIRLLTQKGDQIYSIKTIKSKKDIQWFLKEYIVFTITKNTNKYTKISQEQVKKFSTRQYLFDCYKQQKQVLILTQIGYQQSQIAKLIKADGGYQQNKKKIKRLQFAGNQSQDISFLRCFQNLTALNLSHNSLFDMKNICHFKSLQKLQISNNYNQIIFNQEVCNLEKLQQIKMPQSKITKLPQNIGNLTFLNSINMNKNILQRFPQSICNLINLKQMRFAQNRLKDLPSNLGKLSCLKKLLLNNNIIQSLPISLSQLQNLQILDLSHNALKEISLQIKFPQNLEILRISNNQLQNVPITLSENIRLKQLQLRCNKIKRLPQIFYQLKILQKLTLDQNLLDMFPQSLKECTFLSCLDIFNNKLKQIPDWYANLKYLPSKVNLSNNSFEQFPAFIFKLETVHEINLSSNKISLIPSDIKLCQQLQSLILTQNTIKQVPIELSLIQSLQQLLLTNNQIQYIPTFIKSLPIIKKHNKKLSSIFAFNQIKSLSSQLLDTMEDTIIFTYNLISQIPINLIQFKEKIIKIDFKSNKIKQIPRDIKLFINLNELNLQGNLIEIIPKQLQKLSNLKQSSLQINKNPIKLVECPLFCQRVGSFQTIMLITDIISSDQTFNQISSITIRH